MKTTRLHVNSAVASATISATPQQRAVDRLARKARHFPMPPGCSLAPFRVAGVCGGAPFREAGAVIVPRLRRYPRWWQQLDGCRGTRAARVRAEYPSQRWTAVALRRRSGFP